MSVSLEALAMAGLDYNEWGLDTEEWERKDLETMPPPHLLAEEEEIVKRDYSFHFMSRFCLLRLRAQDHNNIDDGRNHKADDSVTLESHQILARRKIMDSPSRDLKRFMSTKILVKKAII
ncbi:hypothetical protein CFOL_v3_28116 [Cephalotus follicularis]|uniref:Uncharacterized protein n=1 Tax=Cephalotus follicularis TaxID=3775 RepID=A0A1Q3CWR7_CEPFO|nr:hypothetical protein CFOL_v3_28116 [Cephalotus follicularis]